MHLCRFVCTCVLHEVCTSSCVFTHTKFFVWCSKTSVYLKWRLIPFSYELSDILFAPTIYIIFVSCRPSLKT
jgi:hypothetical protein